MNFSKLHLDLNSDFVWRLFWAFCLISVIIVASDAAFAATSTDAGNDIIGGTLCRVTNLLSGNIAKGIATIAIFSVGVGLFLGKFNWGTAALVCIGVGIVFSAGKLVTWISGGAGSDACPTT